MIPTAGAENRGDFERFTGAGLVLAV